MATPLIKQNMSVLAIALCGHIDHFMAMQNRIREWRERRGLTMHELGQRVGTEASQINKLEKGSRRLTAEWMSRLARALDCAPADLLVPDHLPTAGGELGETAGLPPLAPHPAAPLSPATLSPAPLPAPTQPTGFVAEPAHETATPPGATPRDLPVYGAAMGGDDGAFDFNGTVNEYVARPPILAGVANGYAVYVQGESMEPRYFAGELVHVNPNRPITPGCFVVVQIRTGDPHVPTRGLIKQFVRRTASRLHLRQFNPRGELEHELGQVLSIHRIVGASDYG